MDGKSISIRSIFMRITSDVFSLFRIKMPLILSNLIGVLLGIWLVFKWLNTD